MDANNAVQLKGRVACEISNHELIITELVFENAFTNLHPTEIVALLSCFVFQQVKRLPPIPVVNEIDISISLNTVNSRLEDTPIIQTAEYRRLTEINSRYYGLSFLRTLTRGPESVRNRGSSLFTQTLFRLDLVHRKYGYSALNSRPVRYFKKYTSP